MEKHLFKFDNSTIEKKVAEKYDDEKSLQNFLKALIKSGKRLLLKKIIVYRHEVKTDSGRPDFVLIDLEGKIIILDEKL